MFRLSSFNTKGWWRFVICAIIVLLFGYYRLITSYNLWPPSRTTTSTTTTSTPERPLAPRRTIASSAIVGTKKQVANQSVNVPPRTTQKPSSLHQPLQSTEVPCDATYLSSWYTDVSDEQFCDKLFHAIQDNLKHNKNNEFPAPNIGASKDLQHLLQQQLAMHQLVAEGKEPPNQKYLVWSLSGGVGNRVQSLVSTFMAALLSQRVFLMKDWFTRARQRVSAAKRHHDLQFEELDILFDEKWPKNEELLCPALPMMSLRSFREKYPHYFSDEKYKEEHVKVDIIARHDLSNKRWQRLLCNNATESFTEKFVYIWTNQYYLPLFYANPIHAKQMRNLFPNNDAFGPLVRFLFRPHRLIFQRSHEFICEHFHKKRIIGFQIRPFRQGGMDVMAQAFSKCANEVYSGKAQSQQPEAYFVASMYEKVRETLVKIHGRDKIIVLDAARGVQLTGNLTFDREAVSDVFILMYTGDFLLSPGSTFGLLGAGYRSYLPLRVHRTQVQGTCSRMTSSQPCFGSWMSYDRIWQKSQQGVYTCKAQSIPPELDNCVRTF